MGRDANNKGGERIEQLAEKLRAAVEAGEISPKKQSRSSKKRAVKWAATRTIRVASA